MELCWCSSDINNTQLPAGGLEGPRDKEVSDKKARVKLGIKFNIRSQGHKYWMGDHEKQILALKKKKLSEFSKCLERDNAPGTKHYSTRGASQSIEILL